MGSTWAPNRIFDAEAFRKPLGGLFDRSWRLLELKKTSLERLLAGPREIPGQISDPRGGGGNSSSVRASGLGGSLLLIQEGKTRIEQPR